MHAFLFVQHQHMRTRSGHALTSQNRDARVTLHSAHSRRLGWAQPAPPLWLECYAVHVPSSMLNPPLFPPPTQTHSAHLHLYPRA